MADHLGERGWPSLPALPRQRLTAETRSPRSVASSGRDRDLRTVATDDRAPWKGVMAPLLIGLFIFTAADAIGPASGGSFNPARSLDPVLYNWDFGKVWIYLVGPLVGGVIGGAIWVLFGPAREHEPATIRATGGVSQDDAAAASEEAD